MYFSAYVNRKQDKPKTWKVYLQEGLCNSLRQEVGQKEQFVKTLELLTQLGNTNNSRKKKKILAYTRTFCH